MADRAQAAGDAEPAAAAPRGSSPPTFTAPFRGLGHGVAQLGRPEERRIDEQSATFRAVQTVARVPGLRRLVGAIPPATAPGRASVAARDPDAVLASPLYERLVRLRGSERYRRLRGRLSPEPRAHDAAGPPGAPADATAALGSPPRLGPWASRAVDEAIDLLRRVPFDEIQRRGWHFQPNHFYWPLNDVEFLRDNPRLWHDRGLPRGVRWDLDAQLAVARTVERYRPELADVPVEAVPGRAEYAWNNGAFGGADAVVYYGLVRELRPRRVVEVGSGWSSLLLARALQRNDAPCDVTLVEPFPDQRTFAGLPAGWDVHRAILQHADLSLFERLGPGDICFYDGSHCARTGGDVNWFLFEVLPRLAPGVFVQVHDIFLPDDYHDAWVFDEGLSWNEQYVVQAFLMHNDAYRVHIANHMLYRERREALGELYGMDGGSLWLEKTR
ncbi:MAG TPA: class I SAM-dependent methyltransferase [Solirubrobacteraceae bacterium]|nr:class I SAM-dependent methyltransferase [Solirubrobacteraceae bacterium]